MGPGSFCFTRLQLRTLNPICIVAIVAGDVLMGQALCILETHRGKYKILL
jgi:hypothetical protein